MSKWWYIEINQSLWCASSSFLIDFTTVFVTAVNKKEQGREKLEILAEWTDKSCLSSSVSLTTGKSLVYVEFSPRGMCCRAADPRPICDPSQMQAGGYEWTGTRSWTCDQPGGPLLAMSSCLTAWPATLCCCLTLCFSLCAFSFLTLSNLFSHHSCLICVHTFSRYCVTF